LTIEQLISWKLAVERLLSAVTVDWREAVRLASEIAGRSADQTLRHAATQTIPILRNALLDGTDHATTEAARRRLGVLLDVLHELTTPRFGRRDARPKALSPEQRARRVLDLPLEGPLTVADIHRAFRRAAKGVHPDAGGSEQAFREVTAAHDVLMHPGAHKGE